MRSPLAWFFALQGKISDQRRYQVALGLCVLGLIVITASVVLDEHVGPHLLWIVFSELGIACIIAAIAEFILLEHAKKIFQDEIRQDIRIVSHCLEHELVDVMSPSKEQTLSFPDTKPTNGKRAEIRMLAFTLQDLLPSEESLRHVLKHQLDRDERVTLKLLLVDPMSAAGKIRVMAEEGPIRPADSNLRRRAFLSLGEIQQLRERVHSLKEFRIEAGFCNVLPHFYMISTPTDLYIEPYHLGYKRGRHTIARRMPLFRFSSKSEVYESALAHFDYLWTYYEHGSASTNDIRVEKIDDVERRREPRRSKAAEAEAERRVTSERRLKKAS